MASADSCRVLLEVEPRVAMLSFSTKGSASAQIDRQSGRSDAHGARSRCRNWMLTASFRPTPPLCPAWRNRKRPDRASRAAPTYSIFPDLQAGNIAYKLTERLAGAAAIGPILQGLDKPCQRSFARLSSIRTSSTQ
ncbi:MAG: phosphate acyltransferase [Pyrinomonadaceae bacterium]